MKTIKIPIQIALGLMLLMCLNACKKSKGSNPDLAINTWRFDVNNQSTNQSILFSQISGSLSTQGYQLLEMKGEDDIKLNNCRLQMYFNTTGPPPTGTYTVTSYDKLASVPNGVAIVVGQKAAYDEVHYGVENQTIHVIFANGTLEVKFDDLNILRDGSWANAQAKLSVNIRK